MPIRPPPTTYTCPNCGWSKTVAPRSDVLFCGDFFYTCPVCDHEPLDAERATAAQLQLLRLSESLKWLWR